MMCTHDIVVIGASAGGVQALIRFVSELPEDLPAALSVVVHIPADFPSALPAILSRHGNLPALHATEGAPVVTGHIYVAPPDYHLLLEDNVMRLNRGPKENHARPAIDPLFRSAAETYGSRVMAVILSGALSDGTAGLIAVKRHGGIALVQDPTEALITSMPLNAIQQDHPDHILPLSGIAAMVVRLAEREPGEA